MSIRLPLACFILLASFSATMRAQTKSITVDLNTGAFSSGVPFDERFTLMVGSADKLAQSMTLVYGQLAKDQCEKQDTRGICAGAPTFNSPQRAEWKRGDPGPRFIINPLEPNTCYGFHVTQHLQPLGEDDRKKVRDLLSKEFRALLTKAFEDGNLRESELNTIRNALQNTAEKTVAAQFLACIPPVIDLTTEAAAKARKIVLETSEAFNEDKTRNIPARRADVLQALCLVGCNPRTQAWAESLSNDLAKLLADPSVLAPGAALAWSAALNPARTGHNATTMAQVARALALSTPITRAELINGTLKLSGPNLEKATEVDAQTTALLADFFDVYLSDTFRRKKKNGTTEPVVQQALANEIRAAMPMRRLANALVGQITSKQTLDTTQLPDVLAEQVLSRGFNLATTPTVITEGKNPYIGVDAGMGYAFNLDKPYLYVGANFYRVPINKDEKRVPYSGSEGLLKRGSLVLGLATSVDGAKNLLGPGTPMVGLGYRFHRYMKLTGGAIAFKQKDENPLIDKDHTKVAPFIALSIDTDLKALLGGVGKLFGF